MKGFREGRLFPEGKAAPVAPAFHGAITEGSSEEELMLMRAALDELQRLERRSASASEPDGKVLWNRGVRQLLARWHPDKNPEKTELSTRLFAFIQTESEKFRLPHSEIAKVGQNARGSRPQGAPRRAGTSWRPD